MEAINCFIVLYMAKIRIDWKFLTLNFDERSKCFLQAGYSLCLCM